jgi:hypothetical protein
VVEPGSDVGRISRRDRCPDAFVVVCVGFGWDC